MGHSVEELSSLNKHNMYEKFHDDRSRNDGALGIENLITKTPSKTRTTFVAAGDPFLGEKN